MAEVFDLNGTKVDAEGMPADDREQIAMLFESLAEDARAGYIENFITIVMRTEVNYGMVCWRRDTLRLVGACEAAKHDLLFADEVKLGDEFSG